MIPKLHVSEESVPLFKCHGLFMYNGELCVRAGDDVNCDPVTFRVSDGEERFLAKMEEVFPVKILDSYD